MMSEATATATQDDALKELSVRSLLIPLSGVLLLVPNTAVAEVADYQVPQPIMDAPDWLVGTMRWRGRIVPLLAFERLMGQAAGVGGVHARAVVCNTLNGNPQVPFVAVLAQGIPRLQEVRSDMLEALTEEEQDSPAAVRVRLDGQDAVIPDFDALEQMVLQLGIKAG